MAPAVQIGLSLSRRVLLLLRRNLRCLLTFATLVIITGVIFAVSDLWAVGTPIDVVNLHGYGTPNRELEQLDVNSINMKNLVGLKNTTSTPAGHGQVSEDEESCLELKDIPNLVDDRELDLTTTIHMTLLEKTIFQDQTLKIQDVVSIWNQEMERVAGTSTRENNGSSAGRPLILDSLSELEVLIGNYSYLPGGHWRPATCIPRWKVAIIVPYRNRTVQLSMFLRYMVPFLQKQLLEFGIYIVNQENDLPFNRGMLLNVGFMESLNFSHWDCFIFHDVDHVPQSEFNPYGCVDFPRHFVGGVDIRKYKLSYSTWVGGVYGFRTDQYRLINGFGNVYWGWCCEDDDMESRVRSVKLRTHRYKGTVGHYKAIKVHHEKMKPVGELEKHSRVLLRMMRTRLKTDGLNNLRYKTPHLELHALYTNISVDIRDISLPES